VAVAVAVPEDVLLLQGVMHLQDLLVIVAPPHSARLAKYVARKAILPFVVGIGWMKLIMKTPLLRQWLLCPLTRLIRTGTLDTGATDHIPSDLDRLAVHEQYNGGDKVHVGNGTGLRILHTGHASLRTASHSLALRNILHLLSIHKLAHDNDVLFEYHPWHFSIKDRQTGTSLLDGRCEAGLYPLKSSDVATLIQALLSKSTSRVQWHARLGHPSFQTVQSILRLNNISFTSESSLPICSACQVAKSHQLPYVTSVHQSSAPLQMIFSDVWGPAPQSVGGFKYYISFIDDFSKFCWV
jgi:histone deacetylase 1/2